MVKLPDIELLELASRASKTGLPDFVKEQYDAGLKKAARSLWRGMLKIAASGFGKGALLTAAVIVGVIGLWTGSVAVAGGYPFADGLSAGLGQGLGFLTHAVGLTALGIGGALGAASDVRKAQNRLTAEIARSQAQHYALERQLQSSRDKQPEAEAAIDAAKPWNQQAAAFAAREEARRAQAPSRGLGA